MKDIESSGIHNVIQHNNSMLTVRTENDGLRFYFILFYFILSYIEKGQRRQKHDTVTSHMTWLQIR